VVEDEDWDLEEDLYEIRRSRRTERLDRTKIRRGEEGGENLSRGLRIERED
jgi:hypothetical protein